MADPPRDSRIPDLVSLHEAATIIGVTRQYAHRIVMRGELRGARIGTTWVFRRAAVEKYGKNRKEQE
jgi:excisionase family DNA binding protein